MIGKTALGHQVVKDRSVPLTPRQRSALILFDGRRTVDQVLEATAGLTSADIETLFEFSLVEDLRARGLLAAQAAEAEARAQAASGAAEVRTQQERYAEAYPIAAALTAGLGLRGFRLNLAVEAATNFEELRAVAPRISEAVGAQKFRPLERVLNVQ